MACARNLQQARTRSITGTGTLVPCSANRRTVCGACPVSEAQGHAALRGLMQNRLTVAAAHRLSAIRAAGLILALEVGARD
jgi:hypothetical protein